MKKALFLDRDGVINADLGYVYQYKDIEYIEGIFDLVKNFNLKDYLVIIVTNQSGIGRGYYSENQFKSLMEKIINDFKDYGARIDDYYFCSCIPKKIKSKNCINRKPNPGMLLDAFKKHEINPRVSYMIGDKISDVYAGIKADLFCTYYYNPNFKRSSTIMKNNTTVKKINSLRLVKLISN